MKRKQLYYKIPRAAASKALTFSSISLTGKNTVERLCSYLGARIGHTVGETATIAGLGMDANLLSISINGLWQLSAEHGYQPGQLKSSWTVKELAADIDKRVAKATAASNPAGHS